MKLIIAGSRSITNYNLVRQAIISHGIWAKYGRDIEVVCGMAKGVDMLGYKFAENNSLVVHEFPANWDLYGRSAGHRRNREMGDFADELLALWDGESKGTKGMIEYMQSLDKPVYVEIV
jgi:hypothetical protein